MFRETRRSARKCGTGVADVSVTLYDAATQMASAPQYFTILVGGCVGLDNSSVFQGQAAGAVVGNLSATDADGDTSLSYSLVGGRVPFAVQGSQLVTTAALDYDAEPSYNVTVQATDSQGASFQESFTIDVLDATLSIADQSAPEGSPLVFTASLSNALDHAVTIPYQLQQGTAPAGDYSDPGDGSVTIPAGSTSTTIRVNTVDDPANSSDVDFWVVLDPPSDLGGDDTVALGTMQYVAPVLPTISVADASAAAGEQIDFDVTLDTPAPQDTTLFYNLDGGTAEFGKDYEDAGYGSITIPQARRRLPSSWPRYATTKKSTMSISPSRCSPPTRTRSARARRRARSSTARRAAIGLFRPRRRLRLRRGPGRGSGLPFAAGARQRRCRLQPQRRRVVRHRLHGRDRRERDDPGGPEDRQCRARHAL